MTKRKRYLLGVTAILASLGIAVPLRAQAPQETKAELRFFVLDKVGTPVDIHRWTGLVEVTPENGAMKTIRLEPASPSRRDTGKEHANATPEPERYSNSEEFTARTETPADGSGTLAREADGQAERMEAKDLMLCGEARKFEDGWVEMVVVWPNQRQAHSADHNGFFHDHGARYFRAPVDLNVIQDAKTQTVNFSVKATFTTPSGDPREVKGFTYPSGMIDGALTHLIDKDFKDTSTIDHDQAVRLSHKVHWALEALPSLSFAKDKNRQEYEKARQDCQACATRLETAAKTEITKSADDCKSAIKEVRTQATDAQGALVAQ